MDRDALDVAIDDLIEQVSLSLRLTFALFMNNKHDEAQDCMNTVSAVLDHMRVQLGLYQAKKEMS